MQVLETRFLTSQINGSNRLFLLLLVKLKLTILSFCLQRCLTREQDSVRQDALGSVNRKAHCINTSSRQPPCLVFSCFSETEVIRREIENELTHGVQTSFSVPSRIQIFHSSSFLAHIPSIYTQQCRSPYAVAIILMSLFSKCLKLYERVIIKVKEIRILLALIFAQTFGEIENSNYKFLLELDRSFLQFLNIIVRVFKWLLFRWRDFKN